ncbi:MAG: polynucleotide kinase-phosphatase [Verrucomicrobiota bacterium]
MELVIPELSLVVLIGVSGSGKSTFARRHFKPTEILSSDWCRGLVSDDENNQAATSDAFDVLHFIARKRLAAGKLTVVDATNVQPEARRGFVKLAKEFHCLPVAIVLDVPESTAHERNRSRPDRTFGPHVVRQQAGQLHRSLRGLGKEGFRHVHVLKSQEQADAAVITRQPLWNNLKHERGPFDIIGDVHGCFDELTHLLTALDYQPRDDFSWRHPEGRKMVFVGDLVDRGPKSPEVVRLVMESVRCGSALCVPGNHDMKFLRKLSGKNVQLTHGLAETVEQFAAWEVEHPGFSRTTEAFIDKLVSHYVLDDGKLVVAHAGLKESMQGRGSGAVREFALYGETTGETDEFGLPVRLNWALEYRGSAMVVYGHTPVPQAEWLNRTLDIDTGCVFGGQLTALRYPEKEIISVPALKTYAEPRRPFLPSGDDAPPSLSAQQENDGLLDLSDVLGKRLVETRLMAKVTVREENAAAALEVMSRFAANPKWLIYLPPTMSPCGTSQAEGLLEHPAEAFAYFRQAGVTRVICEEKHMGSRAVVIICRDAAAARRAFGVELEEGIGICHTRTGRRFFDDDALESALLAEVQSAVTRAGLWEELNTDWLCLDCELMPWSAKAQELIKQQYAAVGAAATATLSDAAEALARTAARLAVSGSESGSGTDPETSALLARTAARSRMAADYTAAYRQYCWPVNSVSDLKLAPFHLLAGESAVYSSKPHDWHMEILSRLAGGIILATASVTADLTNADSEAAAVRWWEELTARGGEGMVVKPMDFITRDARGLVQPAVKCRGREYLRIIYGPEYTLPENLERLRSRGLQKKRSLALREFALGMESLERFVRHEPLRRVHEAVFGVLALESEPVDPRL